MVLVSNEWANIKDDEQKSTPAAPTTTAATAELAGLVGPGTGTATAAADSTIRAGSIGGVGVGGAASGKRKKSGNMETNKKSEQEQLLQLIKLEKHELETAADDDDDSNENQENNNMEICDSNTNTLEGLSSAERRMMMTTPTQSPGATQQVLHMALNSVLNANNVAVPPLFSSMGGLNNGALLQRESMDCNILSGSPQTASPESELESPSTAKGEAKIVLHCEAKSHKFETRTILLQANQECKVGRLIAKSKASEGNAIFDCKVLSRNHAMLWYTSDGHFWVKDTKSSNGTFINDFKLGNEPAELHFGDTVKFGVEVIENSRQEVHGCIIAKVTLFLPDGREAISIETDQLQLAGPNRISFDEIQRLNSFLQEAAQREKMLKAKLSSLQGVLDSTRKNSAMCWQSMITEDQLLHKINLLEKKLQMMEKNVPENALRNEIVKLLEDKTTYQLTAKEALRKVYQERCDAMQMLSKMELAYATSENECGILRSQIATSKQTLQDFNTRLEQLQQEYLEYKQESLRQQQEAKEQEEQRLEFLKEQLGTQERDMEDMRMQLAQLKHTIAEHDSEQVLQEQNALEQLDAAITDMDDDEDEDDDDDDAEEADDENVKAEDGPEGDADTKLALNLLEEALGTKAVKQKKSKKSKREEQEKYDLKNKVVRKSHVLKWFQNSDLNKGDDANDILNAFIGGADSGDEEESAIKRDPSPSAELSAGIKREAAEAAGDEFVHNSPKHVRLNGIDELNDEESSASTRHLETQETLVRSASNDQFVHPDLPTDQAIEMLQEECDAYKQQTLMLNNNIHELQGQMEALKQQLAEELQRKSSQETVESGEHQVEEQNQSEGEKGEDAAWQEDLDAINSSQVEREEELIVYKERLEQSESSNLELRNEISQLILKQKQAAGLAGNQVFIQRVLPLGCVALAALIYFLSSRF